MKTQYCDKCRHGTIRVTPKPALVCAMLHKPRFYAPLYLMKDTLGWKRKCEDFAQKEIAMTVAELVAYLQTQPQDMQVAYECCSELVLLEDRDIKHVEACEARPDGWIQRKRPDMPTRPYLVFPGN